VQVQHKVNSVADACQQVDYWYDNDTLGYSQNASGRVAQEYGPASDSGTKYLLTDALGSNRLVATSAGTADRTLDFAPFGEEIPAGVALRGSTFPSWAYPHPVSANPATGPSLEFTGEIRDAETGNSGTGFAFALSA
jgi:hypothetical protein